MAIDVRNPDPPFLAFWQEWHLCTLTTLRPEGTPHVVPVGVTYDPQTATARIITRKTSRKVANIQAAGPSGAPVSVCQVATRRWATLEGRAMVVAEPEAVADAVRRYAERYARTPSPDPNRVVIEIALTRAMGNV
jgi:F420H(2)-dependent biliverdin reductase